ncbi:MAG TPA: glycine cleavage system aminomethyltransferase GcvT [Caulobacteraceae bacterium]
MSDEALNTTPLTQAHIALGGRMVPFGGYSMPVQYPEGILKEHLWTRQNAGAFDVSHMGPSFLELNAKSGDGEADHRAIAAIAETLVCGDIRGLKPGQLRYTLMLNEAGGVIDDLMIGRPLQPGRQGMLYVIVNAGTKDGDFALIEKAAGEKARLIRADDRALIAIQGPKAAEVVGAIIPGALDLGFMQFRRIDLDGAGLVVSRSGYTGEDGFEILVPAIGGAAFWDRLLADERVKPIGLGARDSLRLEAGLPLYGHDLDATTSPAEASLAFAVSKRRLRDQDFPGAARVARELGGEITRRRIGLKVLGGPPAREGAEIANAAGEVVGTVTSGGFGPSVGGPIAMGYARPAYAEVGTQMKVIVRGKPGDAEVVAMPFAPHRYFRKAQT